MPWVRSPVAGDQENHEYQHNVPEKQLLLEVATKDQDYVPETPRSFKAKDTRALYSQQLTQEPDTALLEGVEPRDALAEGRSSVSAVVYVKYKSY